MSVEKVNNKRTQLIDTALQLFYKQGIHAIGINEILATSGIAKKTLYNHFASKEALIQACVIERDKRFMAWFELQCSHANSATEFIEKLFDGLDDWINNRALKIGYFNGCFFVNTAAEYGETESEIYQLCMQHKLNIKLCIEQQLGLVVNNAKALKDLTDLLLLLKEGIINCAYVMNDKQAALKAKPLALAFNRI
ncbi:TetR/AcrR family transcriptional regulator [Pseudocolwellia sp. HL-MZ7]|uniref:TetR/AcrR family transcriptional regulator n=1 Tax=Pseudocolwellia sp. HL-MZ7 TaxID=3400627 RepID=UPI003CFA168B